MKHPYGNGYAMKISKKTATQISGGFPLPRIGYGVCVREKINGYGGFYRLSVDNVSGDFFLSSDNVERILWNSIFSIEGIKQ